MDPMTEVGSIPPDPAQPPYLRRRRRSTDDQDNPGETGGLHRLDGPAHPPWLQVGIDQDPDAQVVRLGRGSEIPRLHERGMVGRRSAPVNGPVDCLTPRDDSANVPRPWSDAVCVVHGRPPSRSSQHWPRSPSPRRLLPRLPISVWATSTI